MQHGYIDLGINKFVMFGIAGSGKTCSLAALLEQPPPQIQCSTPLMQRPVQVVVISVGNNMQWKKMTQDQIRQRIAQIIRSQATMRTLETSSNHSNDGQQQPDTAASQQHPPTEEQANKSASRATVPIATHSPSVISASGDTVVPSDVFERNLTPTAQSTLEGTLDSLLESSRFEEEFVKLINNTNPSTEPILQQNWLYIIDSGGQHEFQ